jgi:glycosyltransferase involved in cell wall biosynthesis
MKRKVLHLIGSNLVGGPEKQILHHAVDMKGSDYEIELGSFHDLSDRPEVLVVAEQNSLSTVCLPGGLHLSLVDELSQVLRKRPGYLLCTHGFKSNVVGYLAAQRTKTRHMAFLRGWTAENLRVSFYEVLERQALKRAQWVVCVSRMQAEQVAKLRGKRVPPFVIPNAMLPPYARKQESVVSREALGIPANAFVFGSVGRLSPEKGHRFMLSAFQELCENPEISRPLHLIVVGDGKEQPSLEAQAAQLGIASRTTFAGFQGSPGDWMRLFDCMVQPSLTEGTPNSVLEAMCLNVPVVATAVGGVVDLITHEKNGLLALSGDPGVLAVQMKRMMDSVELREHVTREAVNCTDEYSPARQRERLIAAYEAAFKNDRSEGLSSPVKRLS